MIKQLITDERMFQAGLLRIVMMIRSEEKTFEEAYAEIQAKLRLDPVTFRQYVNAHVQSVVAAVTKQYR